MVLPLSTQPKIWFFSDTHGAHRALSPPAVQIAICCGDEASSRDVAINANESRQFFEWYTGLDVPYKIFVPGNHSTAFERGMVKVPDNIRPLVNESVVIDGCLKIYGSPYTPSFGQSWAYMRNRAKMHDIWQMIPDDTDILITHGPPAGVLDLAYDVETRKPIPVGCLSLYKRVLAVKPQVHAFGHIHQEDRLLNYGLRTIAGTPTTFVNCAVVGKSKVDLVGGGIVL